MKTNYAEKYPHFLTFKGSFKDLKKDGFHFQRLFARNYMQWCFNNGDEFGSDDIRIWRHLGGYVEINDFYHLSKYIARLFCSPDALEALSHTSTLFGTELKYYKILVDRETGEIIKFDYKIHDSMYIFKDRMGEEGIDEEISKWEEDFYKKYRKAIFSSDSWLIAKIREMYSKGWIDPFC